MHGRITRTTIIALLASLTIVPIADAAGPTKVRAKKTRGGVAVFKLPRSVAPTDVRFARMRVGRHARRISARRVRRVARASLRMAHPAVGRETKPRTPKARKLRVRLNRRERVLSHRRKPRLLIYERRKSAPRKVEKRDRDPRGETEAAEAPTAAEAPATGEAPGTAAPVSTETALAGTKSTFRPAGSPVLSDAEAAARVRPSGPEVRPVNATRNLTMPTAEQLEQFRAANQTLYEPHKQLVTGAFTGTTDEIIQWAAWKWGIDEDVFRAQAVQETWWDTNVAGDGGISHGLFQIKRTVHLGTHPLSVDSTAFNADYTGALFRWYYDGHATWVMDVEHGKDYAPGDAWGAIGAHYAGRWWTEGAQEYVGLVQQHLADRTWEKAGF